MDARANPPPKGPAAGTPAAEMLVDEALARRLLAAQHPDLADLPITQIASGWDNCMFRLGDTLGLRLPRRAAAEALIRNEQRWLPELQDRLPLQVPAPVRTGQSQGDYPWPWSVVPWCDGETADLRPPGADQGEGLAAFFDALHQPAPADAPFNPYRSVPLAARRGDMEARMERLAARGRPIDARIVHIWTGAMAVPIDVAPTWIQGDPHPRNFLVVEGRLNAVVDWGDMARGDRACDLAGVWMLLPDRSAREQAMRSCATVSHDTWRRARGWAACFGIIMLDAGLADDPRMAAIAERTFERLVEGP